MGSVPLHALCHITCLYDYPTIRQLSLPALPCKLCVLNNIPGMKNLLSPISSVHLGPIPQPPLARFGQRVFFDFAYLYVSLF